MDSEITEPFFLQGDKLKTSSMFGLTLFSRRTGFQNQMSVFACFLMLLFNLSLAVGDSFQIRQIFLGFSYFLVLALL